MAMIMKVFTTHLDHDLIVKMMKIRIKKKFKSRGRRFDGWNKRCRRWCHKKA